MPASGGEAEIFRCDTHWHVSAAVYFVSSIQLVIASRIASRSSIISEKILVLVPKRRLSSKRSLKTDSAFISLGDDVLLNVSCPYVGTAYEM